jgi:antitoxin VapB
MAMNIKSERAQRVARQLADRTGESLTTAITVAVEERLARLEAGELRRARDRIDQLMAIGADAAPRWAEPWRSTDHGDLLYDSRGLPG